MDDIALKFFLNDLSYTQTVSPMLIHSEFRASFGLPVELNLTLFIRHAMKPLYCLP